ncbi:FG-GAP repeat domain-containing protein [Tahibacter soli]|uniref:VCBS repeat-containing protein n=1 Tax=Tahibacter soli TaxID=2983605 RepID=A0A9X3YR61_9GAMM|nr:VCBS repeat-containing protein [Tahibacter soli]MDC8014836.1 VCBS repeat-containing protein [Tahibacter soli]
MLSTAARNPLPVLILAALTALASACATAPKNPAAVRAKFAQPACPDVRIPASEKFTATPFDTGLPASGQWRDGFDLADMNGDGILDVVHGPPRKGKPLPAIFLGDGHGRFAWWSQAHFPPLPFDYGDAKTGDLNGDGRRDLVIASHLRGVVALVSEGDGHYAPWGEGLAFDVPERHVDTPLFTSRNLAVVDWDGDGKPDILALNEGPTRYATGTPAQALALWVNRYGYWDRAQPENPLQTFGDSLAVGDVDGDGRPDALLGTQVAGSRLVLQIGDAKGYHSRELRSLPLDAAVTAVALHDFDRDGRAEALVAPRAVDGSRFCMSLHHVAFDAAADERDLPLWGEASRDPISVIATGDVDRDGRDDIVAVRQGGQILFFAGRKGGFSHDLALAPEPDLVDCAAYDARLADLDGDGAPELLVSYAGDDIGTGTNRCRSGGGFRAWRLGTR